MSKIIGIIFTLILLLSGQSVYAEDRVFEIGETDIHARVDGNGNMHVTELDTYHFDGSFNGIIVDLNTSRSDGISDFQAFEVRGQQNVPLDFEETRDGSKLQYKVYAQSKDETKVFQFSYSIKNVVQVYADSAVLYWKFFDKTNPSTLESVRIDVELPEGIKKDEISAFGHGPPHGVVNIENSGIVRYEVSPLPSEELLEIRVLFPGSLVPGSTKISDAPILDLIMEEEQRWAGEKVEPSVYGALALLIANLAVGIILLIKFRRATKPEWKGEYYDELPGNVTPAVVSYLMTYRTKPGDLLATMVDLARKRHVEIMMRGRSYEKDKFTFRLLDKPTDELQPHETKLIEWFFRELGHNGTVSLSDIRKSFKLQSNADTFRRSWSEWQDEVAAAATRMGYIKQQRWVSRLVILAVAAQFFGFWFLAAEDWRWLMFCAPVLLFFKPKSQRRTRAGQTEYEKWQGLKRFLRDYSWNATREPLTADLWDNFYVYAISLGEANRMKEIGCYEDSGNPLFDDTFTFHFENWTHSLEKAMAATNNSASSSDSDSGGFFSSGGGGGGGGGGRGAF